MSFSATIRSGRSDGRYRTQRRRATAPSSRSSRHPLHGHDQDRRRAGRLEPRQQLPHVLRRHERVHRDHALLRERQHARRARADDLADLVELAPAARSASGSGARAPRRRRASSRRAAPRRRPRGRSAPPPRRTAMPSERRPFVRSVFPDETRSTIASASPSRGATSTEPVISTSSTGTGISSRVRRGKTVATVAPSRSSSRSYARLRGHGRVEPARAEAELAAAPRRASTRSRTRSSPVIPQSTTPSCTYSGMSSARTSSTSTGALRHGNASARSPGCSGAEAPRPRAARPTARAAAPSRGRRSSDGRRRLLQPVERQAGSRPRRGAASARPASPSSSTRPSAARSPGTAAPAPAAAPPPSGAPSPPAPRACRDPGRKISTSSGDSSLEIASKSSVISGVCHVCRPLSAIVCAPLRRAAC